MSAPGASGMGWQDAVVALIVLCALGYLMWRRVRTRKRAAPCGDCPGCATPVAKLVSAPEQGQKRTAELPIMEITADKRG